MVSALVALLAVLNLDEVEVNWIIGTFDTPLIVVIAVSVLLGAAPATAAARRRTGSRSDASRPQGLVRGAAGLATVVLILGMTAVWVQRQVLDREEWVDTSVELLENDDIRRAIGLYLIDELYTNVDVAGEIQSVLPDRLQPLAQPAAAALRAGG